MSDKQNLGVSLVLALSDLGNCDDCSYMETGSFELFGETREGLECSAEVDIADMCAEAAERIQELEKQLSDAMREASSLAVSLYEKHYESQPDSVPFELCDSPAGVITQINNMVAGLSEQLAESVPKSEIERVFNTPREQERPFPCVADNEDCQIWGSGYAACLSEFEKLLSPPAKENES